MRLAVCLKLVPSPSAHLPWAAAGPDLSVLDLELNPYDGLALEAALSLRDSRGGEFSALCVGGAEQTPALHLALALGAAEVRRVDAPGADAPAAAKCAAAALRSENLDLVLCGRRACDDDLEFFPAALAELLGWPLARGVCFIEPPGADGAWLCRRRSEAGEELLAVRAPAVVSVDRGCYVLREPGIRARLAAKRGSICVRTPAELGLPAEQLAPAFRAVKSEPPPARAPRRILESAPRQAAAELARIIRRELEQAQRPKGTK